jgi:hypothetical protein
MDFAQHIGNRGGTLAGLAALLGIGGAMLGPDGAHAMPDGYLPGEDTLRPSPSAGQQAVNALARGGDAMRELPGAAAGIAPYLVPGVGQTMIARDLNPAGGENYPPKEILGDHRAEREFFDKRMAQSDAEASAERQAHFLYNLQHNPDTHGRNNLRGRVGSMLGDAADASRYPRPSQAPQSEPAPYGAPRDGLAANQTQAPTPIQRPQSIVVDPQGEPRVPPRIPDGYQPGPLQRTQERLVQQNALRHDQDRMVQNALALNGPDGEFYRALKAFQEHFAGAR